MAAEILWLNSRVKEMNGQVVVAFPPTRDLIDQQLASTQPSARTRAVAMIQTLQKTCDQNGIPFADLTEPFSQRWSQKPDLYFSGLDTHPTPAGYEAIAQGVNALLESSGTLTVLSDKLVSHHLR
jgi:lysophospholipase L1-like esterase